MTQDIEQNIEEQVRQLRLSPKVPRFARVVQVFINKLGDKYPSNDVLRALVAVDAELLSHNAAEISAALQAGDRQALAGLQGRVPFGLLMELAARTRAASVLGDDEFADVPGATMEAVQSLHGLVRNAIALIQEVADPEQEAKRLDAIEGRVVEYLERTTEERSKRELALVQSQSLVLDQLLKDMAEGKQIESRLQQFFGVSMFPECMNVLASVVESRPRPEQSRPELEALGEKYRLLIAVWRDVRLGLEGRANTVRSHTIRTSYDYSRNWPKVEFRAFSHSRQIFELSNDADDVLDLCVALIEAVGRCLEDVWTNKNKLSQVAASRIRNRHADVAARLESIKATLDRLEGGDGEH